MTWSAALGPRNSHRSPVRVSSTACSSSSTSDTVRLTPAPGPPAAEPDAAMRRLYLVGRPGRSSGVARVGQTIVQTYPDVLRGVGASLALRAGDRHAGRCHTGQTGEADELPDRGSRHAVTTSVRLR